MTGRSDLVDIECHVFHETEKAWLVQTAESHPEKVWLPKSQCEISERKAAPSKAAILTAPAWLLTDKGLV